MKKRLVALSSIFAILIVVVIVLAFTLSRNSDTVRQIDEDEGIDTSQRNDDNDPLSMDGVSYNIKDMTIRALNEANGEVATDSPFEIEIDGDVPQAILESKLKVSVEHPYTLTKKDNKENNQVYELEFKEPLTAGEVVSINYLEGDAVFGAAFLTERKYMVSHVYPADGASYVTTNTLIEFKFTKDVDERISEYIHFEPSTEGTFEVDNNNVRFIPKTQLKSESNYRIILDEGYSYNGETLEAFESQFTAGWSMDSDFYQFVGESIEYRRPNMPISLMGYGGKYEEGNKVPLKVYKVNEDQFINLRTQSASTVIEALKDNESRDLLSIYETVDYNNGLTIADGLPTGYYYVVVEDRDATTGQMLLVSHYNAFATADPDKLLVWTQNDGGLSNQCKVQLDGENIGKTDEAGLLEVNRVVKQEDELLLKIETQELIPFYMVLQTSSYEKDPTLDYWTYLNTDRGYYLPTDQIRISGFVKKKSGQYPTKVTVRLKDDNLVLDEKEVMLSKVGDFELSFSIEEVYRNNLEIEVLDGELLVTKTYVSVEEFVKPTYNITIETDKKVLKEGEEMTIYGEVTYFEGTPMANPTVSIGSSWKVDLREGMENAIVTGDANGRYELVVAPFMSEGEQWQPKNAYVDGVVNNIDREYMNVYADYIFVPRDRMLLLDSEQVEGEAKVSIDLREIVVDKIETAYGPYEDYMGAPVSMEDVNVEIKESYYIPHYIGQKYDPILKYFYDEYSYEYHEEIISTQNLITNESGQIFVPVSMEENHRYSVRVATEDSRGKSIVETISLGETRKDDWEDTYVYMDMEKYAYNPGELVRVNLSNGSGRYVMNEKAKTLFYVVYDGIKQIEVLDDSTFTFTYPEALINQVSIYAVTYNGSTLRSYDISTTMNLDKEARALSIEVTTDKDSYGPGEIINGSVVAKRPDGSAAQGFVEMKVVDEAYYAMYDETYRDNPIGKLFPYTYDNVILGTSYATEYRYDYGYGAEGGEGGEGYVRSEFETTAEMKNLALDGFGRADFQFKLPDNLTSWRMTFIGVDPDIYAGVSTKTVEATLPFQIRLLSSEVYYDNDDIGVCLKIASKALTDTPVKMVMSLKKGDEIIEETTIEATMNDYIHYNFGTHPVGDYELLVKGENEDYRDAISQNIQVVESRQHLVLSSEAFLEEETLLIHNDQPVELKFMNEEAWIRYEALADLVDHNSERLENRVTSYMILNYMKDIGMDVGWMGDEGKPYPRNYENGLYQPLADAQGEVIPTVDVLIAGWADEMSTYDIDTVTEALMKKIMDKTVAVDESAAAMYGLALLGEPMLSEMKEALDNSEYQEDNSAMLYLIKGLTYYGDYNKAKKTLSQLGLMGIGSIKQEDIKDNGTLMMIYCDLNETKKSQQLYNYLEGLKHPSEPVIAQLYYYMTHLPTNLLEVSFDMVDGDEVTSITLDYDDVYRITLSPEQAERVRFEHVNGQIIMKNNFIGSYVDVEPSDTITVRTEMIGSGDAKVGDEIEVIHHVNVKDGSNAFSVQEVIPTGTVLVGKTYATTTGYMGESINAYAHTNEVGDRVETYVYLYPKDDGDMPESYELTITYKIRAIAIGQYYYEPMVVENANNKMAVSNEAYIQIHE